MSFTQNWFENLALKNFETLKNLIDINKPINFLEIGCFEGNCHKFVYENILLNPNSKSTVVDPFDKSLTHNGTHVYNIFTSNLSKYLERITIHKGYSDDILPSLEKESYDIIYIDGDHTAEAVYNDAINSFHLLKHGGIMIFDDYTWNINEKSPRNAIDRFIKEFNSKIEILFINNQVGLKKISN